uniref:Fibronectin type-III domain-containing protein n=1 Tax=Oryzias sinensis TaxID=183150 RepID=A0A8C8DNI3_9TELE
MRGCSPWTPASSHCPKTSGTGWQNHSIPANTRSLAISGLLPSTWYRVTLYGVHRGELLEPTFADTITGINTIELVLFFSAAPLLQNCSTGLWFRNISSKTLYIQVKSDFTSLTFSLPLVLCS